MIKKKKIVYSSICVKLNTKKNIDLACDYLRLQQNELIEFALEALGLTDVNHDNEGKKNPFLSNNYWSEIKLDFERYKLVSSLENKRSPK